MGFALPGIIRQVDKASAPRQQVRPVDRTAGDEGLIGGAPDARRRAIVAGEGGNDPSCARSFLRAFVAAFPDIFFDGIVEITAQHCMRPDLDKYIGALGLQAFNRLRKQHGQADVMPPICGA